MQILSQALSTVQLSYTNIEEILQIHAPISALLLACLHYAIQVYYKDKFNEIPLSLTTFLSLETPMYI